VFAAVYYRCHGLSEVTVNDANPDRKRILFLRKYQQMPFFDWIETVGSEARVMWGAEGLQEKVAQLLTRRWDIQY
jgi:hypothetical protein